MADWNKVDSRGKVEDRRGMGPAVIGGVTLTGLAVVLVMNLLNGGDLGSALLNTFETVVQQEQTTQDRGDKEERRNI